jgi:valyl-tRNA synthetase
VPIIADDVVDRAFGTGAVKITPAHDQDDYATGKRHDLPMPTILADDATIANTGTRFDGLDRYEAREMIVAGACAHGDLADQKPHEMIIGRCQRSNDVLEPRLKTQCSSAPSHSPRGRWMPRAPADPDPAERFEKTWSTG